MSTVRLEVARSRQQPDETDAMERYTESFRRLRAGLTGSGIPWVQRLRQAALNRFVEQGFPTLRWEEWKYTDVRPIEKRAFAPVSPDEVRKVEAQDVEPYLFDSLTPHVLVFVDGHYTPALSNLGTLPNGVIVQHFAEALPRHVDLFEPHLARYADMSANPFVALNTALMSDGVFVHLPPNACLDEPLHVLYLGSAECAAHIRNLIVAEEGAKATVIEHYAGSDNTVYWHNAVTEVVTGNNAGVVHFKLVEEGDKAFHVATVQARQSRDSRFTSHNVALGGRLVRNDINTSLDGEGAECILNGLYMPQGRQHVDNHTRIDHAAPRASSRELYKGVLDDYSRGVFNGKVIVHKDAQQTDSNQTNHNLLLSPNAEVDPKPQLEIFADDVKCTHGVTVGELDEEALYYLRSRGVPLAEARILLTFAFANDVITHMNLEPVRARLERLIRERLPRPVAEDAAPEAP